MSLIMGLIALEQLELFALELEKLLYLTLFTLEHLQLFTNGTKLCQLVPNLVKIYMTPRFWTSPIMGVIKPELELFSLELEIYLE